MNIKPVVDLLSAALTPVIAILAAYIAYQQYRVSQDTLRLALYEKRYKVFQALMDLLAYVQQEGDVSPVEIRKFVVGTNDSIFLFDEYISDYIQEIRKKAGKLYTQNKRLQDQNLPVGEERSRLAEENKKLLEWFDEQIHVSRNKFFKYLRFK